MEKLMTDANAVSGTKGQRRWLILGVIGLAQLMVVRPGPLARQSTPSRHGAGAMETAAGANSAISA